MRKNTKINASALKMDAENTSSWKWQQNRWKPQGRSSLLRFRLGDATKGQLEAVVVTGNCERFGLEETRKGN